MTHTKTNIVQYNEYYPFGLQASTSWTREHSTNNFLYNSGAELNTTSGLYDTFYRGFDPALGRFMQVDPLAHEYHSVTPYQYALNNPALLNDPNGDKVSQFSNARNAYLERYADNWHETTVLDDGGGGGGGKRGYNVEVYERWYYSETEEGGVIDSEFLGYIFEFEPNGVEQQTQEVGLQWITIWTGQNNIISTTAEAKQFYETGDGSPRLIDQNSSMMVVNSPEFQRVINRLVSGKANQISSSFDMAMTSKVFHIGDTNVDYETTIIGSTAYTKFTLFARDGFWDPNVVLEALGVVPDGMGPNLETKGSHPYQYVPVVIVMKFSNPGTYGKTK